MNGIPDGGFGGCYTPILGLPDDVIGGEIDVGGKDGADGRTDCRY